MGKKRDGGGGANKESREMKLRGKSGENLELGTNLTAIVETAPKK